MVAAGVADEMRGRPAGPPASFVAMRRIHKGHYLRCVPVVSLLPNSTLRSPGSPRGEADRGSATTEFGDLLILNGKHMSSRHAELRLGPRSAAGFSCRRCLPQIVGRTEFFMSAGLRLRRH